MGKAEKNYEETRKEYRVAGISKTGYENEILSILTMCYTVCVYVYFLSLTSVIQKVKFTLQHAMKGQRVSIGTVLHLL
jgi:hypothetical protein